MMRQFGPAIGGVLVAIVAILAYSALFIVNEMEQAIVFQFGDAKRVIREPGINAKLPFVQNVRYFEDRLLDVDPPAEQMILADQKRLVVDSYTRYHIQDPLKFYQAVQTEEGARARLRSIVNAALRSALGEATLPDVLSKRRAKILRKVSDKVTEEAKTIGVEITEVRMRRADLPQETMQAIYSRMESERAQEAAEYRAKGRETAQQIRARADRERTVLLAGAREKAQTIRGEGEAKATRIYAQAYQQDPAFFSFYRSLGAYGKAFNEGDTTMVLSPDSEFFRFFGQDLGNVKGVPPVRVDRLKKELPKPGELKDIYQRENGKAPGASANGPAAGDSAAAGGGPSDGGGPVSGQ